MTGATNDGRELIGLAITAVNVPASDPNVHSIRIGRRVVARVTSADVDALDIEVGTIWTEALAERVERAQRMHRARRDALRLLATRDRSEQDLSDRLRMKDHADDVIAVIIDELRQDGWLNEHAFADQVAQQTLARGPAGRALVLERMRARGVEPAQAERATSEAIDCCDVIAEAVGWARKKLKADARDVRSAARLAAALSRRGLDEDDVREVLRRLALPVPEDAENDS